MYGTRDLGNAHMELLKERVFHRKRSGKVEIHIMIHEDLLKNLSVSLFIGLFFWFVYFYFFKILLRFREKGREGEREGEKHQCVVGSCTPPTGDLAHNPGVCPDWESNW